MHTILQNFWVYTMFIVFITLRLSVNFRFSNLNTTILNFKKAFEYIYNFLKLFLAFKTFAWS